MRKWILMLVCVLTLSALSVCFAEDSDNSGEVTAQQSYVNEAITVTSEISADAPSQSPVLRDVAYMTQGGRQLIIKLYDIDSDYDVSRLAEPDFEEGELLYTHKNSIKVSDNRTMETKQASQTVTVSHTEKDNAMGSLQPMLEYSENGFTGQLMLQPESITTTEAGKESYGYTVSDTREYPNLDRNDTAYIPKVVEKNGVSLTLAGIDWQAMGNGTFTATASYSGRATGSKVTGYTSKAIYSGEVSKETLDSCTYKVIYEGAPIPAPYLQYGLTAGSVLALLIILAVLWNRRKNAKIYALLDGEFKIVRRVRISYIDPIVDLTSAAVQSRVSEYIITIDRWATKRLNNQRLRILCGDGMVREQTIVNTGYGYKIHLEAIPIPAAEEYKEDEYDKTFLLDSLSSITLLHDANTQIRYMPADTVIFSSGDNDIGTYIREQMLTSGTHMLKDTPFGELIAFKQISLDRNWEFTTSLSTDIFYSTTSSFTQLVIFFIALQIIIGILLTILFSVQSYSPIRRMLSKLHNITDEFFTPSQTLEFDEIEQITRRLVGDRNHLKAEIDEMYPMLLKGLLLQILNGNRSERDCALNYTVQFADYFPHEGFACAKISVEDNRGFAQDDSLTEMQLTRLVIRNITEELLSVHQPVVSIDSDIRNVVIVFNFPWCEEKTALEQTMQTLISELKKAQLLIAERFEIYTNIGLSQPLPGISNLYKCHLQAQSALTYKTGSNVYDLTYYNETQTNESTYSYSLDTEIYLMSSAKVGDYEKVVHILNTLTEENASVIASKTAAVFRCFIMALYGTLLRLCEELSVSPEALGIDIPKRLSLNYSSNIMHQIHKDYESICHWVNQSKKSHNDILKEQIIGYIHEHCYDNSLSLVSVADHIGINPTYLSSFIKEQIGETFLTYVLNLRMERAKELLRSTNLSQHEIAVRIGYANSGVFLRVFKKKYGLTPGAYRQQQHK